jgi:hypothetical protein
VSKKTDEDDFKNRYSSQRILGKPGQAFILLQAGTVLHCHSIGFYYERRRILLSKLTALLTPYAAGGTFWILVVVMVITTENHQSNYRLI